MLVNFYKTTERNIPEHCHLHTHCHENLKSHFVNLYGMVKLICIFF
jgi:hypothetical protein